MSFSSDFVPKSQHKPTVNNRAGGRLRHDGMRALLLSLFFLRTLPLEFKCFNPKFRRLGTNFFIVEVASK